MKFLIWCFIHFSHTVFPVLLTLALINHTIHDNINQHCIILEEVGANVNVFKNCKLFFWFSFLKKFGEDYLIQTVYAGRY